jgi:hypothetical protein
LRIHLFSQSLTTTRDSHATLAITSPRRLLRPLSAFTISIEQYSTYSKDFLTYLVHFPSRKTLALKVSWTDVEATRDPQRGKISTYLPFFHRDSFLPTTFRLHIISSHRRVQHLRPFHRRGLCLTVTTARLYHLQHEPARLTSPSFAAQHLTFLSRSLNIFQPCQKLRRISSVPRRSLDLHSDCLLQTLRRLHLEASPLSLMLAQRLTIRKLDSYHFSSVLVLATCLNHSSNLSAFICPKVDSALPTCFERFLDKTVECS